MGKTLLGTTREEGKDDDTRFLAKAASGGARLTFNNKGYYGHEFTLGWFTPTVKALVTDIDGKNVIRQKKSTARSASYNFLMYMMPAGEWFRPYLTGGAQVVRFNRPSIEEWTTGIGSNIGFNYGGGIKLRPFSHALIRLDARHIVTGKPYDLQFPQNLLLTGSVLHHLEATAGVSVTF
jgi:opacity protein-like surface antigen